MGKYGGSQAGMTQLQFDPNTGEMVPVTEQVEVSPNTQHREGPLASMLKPRATNIGVYAALAALGADKFSGLGGGGNPAAAAPSAASSAPNTGIFQAMAAKGIPGGVGIPGMGAGAGVGDQIRRRMTNVDDGMGFMEKAGLLGLQSGLGMLGAGLAGDEDRPKTELEHFAGSGPWSDPIEVRQKNNQIRTAALRGFADRSQRTIEGSPVSGLDFGSADLVNLIDQMFGQGRGR